MLCSISGLLSDDSDEERVSSWQIGPSSTQLTIIRLSTPERIKTEYNLWPNGIMIFLLPLKYCNLVTHKSATRLSGIMSNLLCIYDEFQTGLERLYQFLDQLSSQHLFDPQKLKDEIRSTKAFLEKPSIAQTYFLLECGEILDMGDTTLS